MRTASSSPIEAPAAWSRCLAGSSSGTMPRGSPPPSPKGTGRWRRAAASSRGRRSGSATWTSRRSATTGTTTASPMGSVVRAPLPMGHRQDADVRRANGARLGGLRRGEPVVRPCPVRGSEARPDLPHPGLPLDARATAPQGDGPRGAHPALLAHPVRRADLPGTLPVGMRNHLARDAGRRRRGVPGPSVGRELPPVRPRARRRPRRHPRAPGRGGRQAGADPVLPRRRGRAGDPGGGRDRSGEAPAHAGGEVRGGRKLLLRVDRLEPSKNILAGSWRSSSSCRSIRSGAARSCSSLS